MLQEREREGKKEAEQVKHACSELVNARTHLPAQDGASVLSHTSNSQGLEAF